MKDNHVVIWKLPVEIKEKVLFKMVADLDKHTKAVNCVRWSPNAEMLASCDDDSNIFIWRQREVNEKCWPLSDEESWYCFRSLRGHREDVYDLCFSPDSNFLLSGSIDCTAIVWNVQQGRSQLILDQHNKYVQGVAWDPLNKYFATISADGTLRIFDAKTKKVVVTCAKSVLPVPKESPFYKKSISLFYGEHLQTFFRRLSFSPDGKLILVPSGHATIDGTHNLQFSNSSYIFSRYCLNK